MVSEPPCSARNLLLVSSKFNAFCAVPGDEKETVVVLVVRLD